MPDGDDAVATDVGVDLGRVEALQVADNHIVGKLLVACSLRMLVESVTDSFIINHKFFSLSEPSELSELFF